MLKALTVWTFAVSQLSSFAQTPICRVASEPAQFQILYLECLGPAENLSRYEMLVSFDAEGEELKVPGAFWGGTWRAETRLHKQGIWKYRVSFREKTGNPAAFNNEIGSFVVAPPANLSITQVSLYDDVTDQVIPEYADITSSTVIDLNRVNSSNLNFLIRTFPEVVGSVRMKTDAFAARNENQAPYTAFNETNEGRFAAINTDGTHTIAAQAFSEAAAKGTAGPAFTLSFRTIARGSPGPQPTPTPTPEPTPTPAPPLGPADFDVYFYDESTKAPVAGVPALRDGIQIDGRLLEGKALNIVVQPKFSGAMSMNFSFNGGNGRNENEAPFTVLRETGSGNNAVLVPGSHSFVARAFSQTGGRGTLLKELTLRFGILPGPDRAAPVITATNITGQFKVSVTFNEEARGVLRFAKRGSADWKAVASSAYQTQHVFDVVGAEATGWVYRIESEDTVGNRGQTAEADLKTTPPARDYDKLIAEQFVKGDNFARKNAQHLAHNTKLYKWPAGRSKDNPHDCYIVARAYHDHMKFYEKGYAHRRDLYQCPPK